VVGIVCGLVDRNVDSMQTASTNFVSDSKSGALNF
jgi:hypothetical protein